MNAIDRLIFRPKGGQFREYEGITVHLEPADLSLYRQLIPPPLEAPSHPIVTLYLVDFIRVANWPLRRYQEWSVLLKCALAGEAGWFSLTMPVTSWLAMTGGRSIGFPKYVADEIAVEHRGETVFGRGKHRGVQQLELEFNPGLSRPLAEWERELMDDPSFFKSPQNFQLIPPGKGPRVLRIDLEHVVEPHWSPCPGMVRVKVDPSENWAGLVPPGAAFVGSSNHFVGGADIVWTHA